MKFKKTHISICLLVLIISITVSGLINQSFNPQYKLETPKASAGEITIITPENIEDWQYFREINLNPSTPESDYQVKVMLDTLNFNYSKANPDGSDIRFLDQNQNQLSYWVEKWDDTSTSIIWVKIPTSGTSKIYMYYGNPITTSLSNGINTFEFFDDFQGTSLNASKWNTEIGTYCGISVSSGYVRIYSNAPNTFAELAYFGFTDFYFNQGSPGWIHPSESITISIAEDTSWHTNEIRWTNLTSAPYYKNDVYVSEDTTLEDTTLTVRFLAHTAYSGPGTPWGAWIWTDDNTLGQMGRGLRTKTSVDLTDISDLRVDWVAVFKYSELNPSVTIGMENKIGPDIIVNAPIANSLYGTIAPLFNITIADPDFNFTWYSLDGGSTNVYSNETLGIIDQTEWDLRSNGTVTITFYANNSLGDQIHSEITVRKDILAPLIMINTPTVDQVCGAEAPMFDLTILEHQISSTWYSLDYGNINISFSSSSGTIDQTEWAKKGGGTVPIRFYANDSFGNTDFSEVIVVKDLISPIVSINQPSFYEIFGSTPPNFNITITESNPDSMWYTLDSGATNITFGSLTGTIDQTEWDKQGNGTVTVIFYARDEGGNEGSAQVTIRKEATPPLITINSPNENDLFHTIAPTFEITIQETDLNTTWYTLDDGVTKIIFTGLTGSIDQTEWDKYGNGTIPLKFYANDSYGFENFAQVMIHKDISAPIITINSPEQDEIFSSIAPAFDITVIDSQLDSMWYTIDNGLTIIPITSQVGTIDQTEWEKKGGGNVPIRFYANDTLGNTAYSEVVIIKNVLYGIDPIELLTPSAYSQINSNLLNFSWSSLEAGFGAVNFTLQVSNATDFSHIIFQLEDIAETPIVTNFSVPLSITQGQYYWRVRPTYRNSNGSWSDYFSFTYHVNNNAPNLVLDEYTPTTGTRFTIFKFTAIYYDLDNNPPSYIKIILNGTSYFMEKLNPSDIDYTDGCVFQFLTCLVPFEYAYIFSFECSDGGFYDSTSTFIGPLVESEDPPDGEQGLDDLNSTNAMIMGISIVTGLGIVIPMVVLTEIKIKKNKIKPKHFSKIKK